MAARQASGGLAAYLRSLREDRWPDADLTQAKLASALSGDKPVGPATISTWESATNPKTPSTERLRAYARFFATRRSLDGGRRLIPEDELTEDEHTEFRALEERLLGMVGAAASPAENRPGSFTFTEGPVTIICPDRPPDALDPLAQKTDPNYTKLLRYADLDALVEIHGHVRAANPTLDVFHRLASEARADDISSHVILLGGIWWNQATRSFQRALSQVPVTQVAVAGQAWEPFVVEQDDGSSEVFDPRFEHRWTDEGTESEELELVEDVGLLARLPNPFNSSRTLTICNGIHSRGVYGAVRCLTDAQVRVANEAYLAERFGGRPFALLLRVPVVTNATISPDLQTSAGRLFEWPAQDGGPA